MTQELKNELQELQERHDGLSRRFNAICCVHYGASTIKDRAMEAQICFEMQAICGAKQLILARMFEIQGMTYQPNITPKLGFYDEQFHVILD